MGKNTIWVISILSILLLSGCATSTADLVKQAQLTSDWTLANKRFEAIERREAQRPQSCLHGMKSWCVKRFRKQSCSCVSDSEFRDRLDSLLGM